MDLKAKRYLQPDMTECRYRDNVTNSDWEG